MIATFRMVDGCRLSMMEPEMGKETRVWNLVENRCVRVCVCCVCWVLVLGAVGC